MITNKSIEQLFNLDKVDNVGWNDLDKVPYGIWIDAEKGIRVSNNDWRIRYRKIKTKALNQLLFQTELKPLCEFNTHRHKDCKETITPINTKVLVNNIIYNTLSQATVHKDVKHIVKNPNRKIVCKLLVEFNRAGD